MEAAERISARQLIQSRTGFVSPEKLLHRCDCVLLSSSAALALDGGSYLVVPFQSFTPKSLVKFTKSNGNGRQFLEGQAHRTCCAEELFEQISVLTGFSAFMEPNQSKDSA